MLTPDSSLPDGQVSLRLQHLHLWYIIDRFVVFLSRPIIREIASYCQRPAPVDLAIVNDGSRGVDLCVHARSMSSATTAVCYKSIRLHAHFPLNRTISVLT